MYSIKDFWGSGTRPFTIEELRAFFKTFDINNSWEERRSRIYFLTQFYMGLRKNSVDSFNLKGICWSRRFYRVINDKGKDRYENNGKRIIPIPYELLYHLRQHYLSDMTDIELHNGYFFYIENRDIPYPNKYNKIFREHIKLANLEEVYMKPSDGANPRGKDNRRLFTLVTHSFRKSYATLLLEKGCDLPTLMNLLGHSSFLSTHRYTKLSLRQKYDIISIAFDGRVNPKIIKPLILLDDTPYIETKDSIVNVAVTQEQLELLTRMGIINPETNTAEIIK